MKNTLTWSIGITLAFLLAWAIYTYESYNIDLYKKKFPGTTTLDYWLDKNNK